MLKNILRQGIVAAVRHYSRASPPPPVDADPVIRVSNNIARVGCPKEGPKPRQLLSLPEFPDHPLPGKNSVSVPGQSARVTAISWIKYYFDDIPGSIIQSHFNKGLVRNLQMIDSWSKEMRFDGQSKDIARDLLRGAFDLQESLIMLSKLQDASTFDGQSKDIARDQLRGAFDLQESLIMLSKLQDASMSYSRLLGMNEEGENIEGGAVVRCCEFQPKHLFGGPLKVQMECSNLDDAAIEEQGQTKSLKKINPNEVMEAGAKVYVPVSVAETKISKRFDTIPSGTLYPNADEIEYLQRLVMYKACSSIPISNLLLCYFGNSILDSAIIVLNKPPKLPVKGNLPVHNSMDALAAAALSYGYEEGPKLVHRLDRESSGLLLMGRTKESIARLHWLFSDINKAKSSSKPWNYACEATVQRYWALVIGSPKEKQGLIHAPLSKVLLNDGKTERVILSHLSGIEASQEAITEYRVLGPMINGCSWIELCPLTGRKHQLRVHCAEALGTPIVGDYKYGWYVHQRWKQMPRVDIEPLSGKPYKLRRPEGLDVQKGSVLSKVPLLHLHCRELVLPNIVKFLEILDKNSDCHSLKLSSKSDVLRFVAPMPSHMKISWNLISINFLNQSIALQAAVSAHPQIHQPQIEINVFSNLIDDNRNWNIPLLALANSQPRPSGIQCCASLDPSGLKSMLMVRPQVYRCSRSWYHSTRGILHRGQKPLFGASSRIAEAEAIRMGLLYALSQNLIDLLVHEARNAHWELHTILADITRTREQCGSVMFCFIPRQANHAAHKGFSIEVFFSLVITLENPDPLMG
ncbi:hypothetical protein HHK36_010707 [Tetracentron sinense]|uniref:Pseudouridine synthase RsuA/RluA-like domain-containing protein n=1 Tax=Tetracentron sinense TaxID=13715 RepID=A0A835DFJ4_TETSI|nr:hypothetical protein HHK36_010707 [Tetracentron sinense]